MKIDTFWKKIILLFSVNLIIIGDGVSREDRAFLHLYSLTFNRKKNCFTLIISSNSVNLTFLYHSRLIETASPHRPKRYFSWKLTVKLFFALGKTFATARSHLVPEIGKKPVLQKKRKKQGEVAEKSRRLFICKGRGNKLSFIYKIK